MSIDPTLGNNNSFEDTDIELGRPSYDEASYIRPHSTFKIVAITAGVIGFSAISAGLYYFAYQQGLAEGQRLNPPIIAADPGPIRVTPDEAGITSEPAPELNIYKVMTGEGADSAPPAANDGRRESLLNENIVTPQTEPEAIASPSTPTPSIAEAPKLPAPKATPVQEAKKPVASEKATTQSVAPPAISAKTEDKPKAAESSATPSASPRFMVQLSATRSRAIARQTYTNLQKKYPLELQSRDPLIFRADLGAKGIFYRVNVGGFSSKENANEFCNALKAKGASCLVKNEPS
jgi:cell division septation protein DedD